jgi:hypothetical protein
MRGRYFILTQQILEAETARARGVVNETSRLTGFWLAHMSLPTGLPTFHRLPVATPA